MGPKFDHCLVLSVSQSLCHCSCWDLTVVTLVCEDHANCQKVMQPILALQNFAKPKQFLKFGPHFFFTLCQTKPSLILTNISKLAEASALNWRCWLSQSIKSTLWVNCAFGNVLNRIPTQKMDNIPNYVKILFFPSHGEYNDLSLSKHLTSPLPLKLSKRIEGKS